jgi:hypothetical protein
MSKKAAKKEKELKKDNSKKGESNKTKQENKKVKESKKDKKVQDGSKQENKGKELKDNKDLAIKNIESLERETETKEVNKDSEKKTKSKNSFIQKISEFKFPKKISTKTWLIIFSPVLVILLGVAGYFIYLLSTNPIVTVQGESNLENSETEIYIEDKKIELREDGKFELDKNELGKELRITHPDYKEYKTQVSRNSLGIINPKIALEPVDFAVVTITLNSSEIDIEKNKDLVSLGEVELLESEKEEGEQESQEENKKTWELYTNQIDIQKLNLNIDLKDFTTINQDLDIKFGRNDFEFDLEYNKKAEITFFDAVTGEPIPDLEIVNFDQRTDQDGFVKLEFLQNYEELEFKKEGYLSKKLKIEADKNVASKIGIVPSGKMAYPKKVEPSQDRPFSITDLYQSNYDGSEEKLIQENIVTGYQKGDKFYYSTDVTKGSRNETINYSSGLFEVDLNSLEKKMMKSGVASENDKSKEGSKIERYVDVKSRSIIELSEDNIFYPSYNRLTLDSAQNSKPVTVRVRNFKSGTSETTQVGVVSLDGKLISYATRRYTSDNVRRASFGAADFIPTGSIKVVEVASNDPIFEKNLGLDNTASIATIAKGNKYLIYNIFKGDNFTSSNRKLVNLESKNEIDFKVDGEIFYEDIQRDHVIYIYQKKGNTRRIIQYNLESKEEKVLLENSEIKNFFGNNNIIYVRVGEDWNILSKKGDLTKVSIKPYFGGCYGYFELFWNVARGCDTPSAEQRERME